MEPAEASIREFLTRARLNTYLAPEASMIRVKCFSVFAYSEDADGPFYTDMYYASDDDRTLRGVETVLSNEMQVHLRISYTGGFEAVVGLPLSAKDIFNRILLPCRTAALADRRLFHEGVLQGFPYRYEWQQSANTECETISISTGGSWSVVHKITFVEETPLGASGDGDAFHAKQ
ncbi:MAG: hypothetical protein JSU63_17765 [Phycisphaerales bacterium]|nr:MAG: hypothetical protein JSU63_17765 [Phycisphaerales bacterium]